MPPEWVTRIEDAIKDFAEGLKGKVGEEAHNDIDGMAHTLRGQLVDVVSTVEADAKADATTAAAEATQIATDAQHAPEGSQTLPAPSTPPTV